MRSLLASRLLRSVSGLPVETLVLFCADVELDAAEFDGVLTAEVERDIWPDEVLLVLRHDDAAGIERRIEADPRLSATFDKLPQRMAVTVATFGPDGGEINRVALRGERSRLTFDSLRNPIMTEIFARRGGFVRSTEAYHFRNPSDRHTDRFMRLANALVRRAEVSFFAFGCLPYVPRDALVAYVDTPSIFGLVGAINEHRVAQGWPPVAADCFGSYEGLRSYGGLRTRESVFLISASSSGKLAEAVARTADGIPKERIVHVTYLGNRRDYPIVCDLNHHPVVNTHGETPNAGDWRSGSCPLCERGSIAIALSGDQFEIPAPLPSPLLIAQPDAPKGLADQVERLVGSAALSVGLGSGAGGMKQMHVRADALALSEAYVGRLRYAIARVVPASAKVIVKLDASSGPLVNTIRAALGREVEVVERKGLPELARNPTTDAVVIAASVIESGRSLQDISRELRSSFPEAPQVYVVGFAKAESEKLRTSLRSSLTKTAAVAPHEFVAVETMLLPADPSVTAWSLEFAFWQRLVTNGALASASAALSERVSARIERLRQSSEPLVDELFIANSAAARLELEHGFVFWPDGLPAKRLHSQADVFFTISSVLQNLRQGTGARVLRANSLQHTLIAAGNFGRFNDSIIQASLARAALPPEVNYAADRASSAEMGRIVRRIIENAHKPRGGAAAEMLLAIATGRLTLHADDLARVLEPLEGAPEMVALLMDACRPPTAGARPSERPGFAKSRLRSMLRRFLSTAESRTFVRGRQTGV